MQRAVQPTVLGGFQAGRSGFHEVLRIEVRAGWVGRASGVNDCQVALFPKRLKGREGRVKSEEAVEIDDLVARDVDGWAHGVVGALVVWHDDVEAIGRAALEDDNQPLVVHARRLGTERGASEKRGNGCGADDSQAAVSQKYSPCD